MSLADDLNVVRDQLVKAQSEIVTKVSDLESALASAGTDSAEVTDAVAALKSVAQSLDDVVPDVVVEPVVDPVPPVE
jgi:hypothetical protein